MDILMPQLGETVTEGKIISWARSVGDTVAHGDVLFEIETDKATMEVEATSAGRISDIRVNAGDVAPVGAVVAVISSDADRAADPAEPATTPASAKAPVAAALAPAKAPVAAAPAPPAKAPMAAHSPAPVEATPEAPGGVWAAAADPFNAVRSPEKNFGPATLGSGVSTTPLARRLAAEAGIDLATLTGGGPGGRITAKDVTHRQPAATAGSAGAATQAARAGFEQIKAQYDGVPFTVVELDGMRRTIAKRLVESKQTVPHFYLSIDVDLEKMLALRQTANAAQTAKLSVNDFVVKAFALALAAVPAANAVWAEDRILRFARVDMGIAVAVDGGLFTPVVRDAGTKSVVVVAAEIRALAQRARDRKLKPQDYQGGAASVSNLGMFGVRQFSAIINAPQSTILAVGAAQRRPVEAADGSVRFSTQMTVTLSCDHRVVDGALGAELLAAFKKVIEEPVLTLL